MVNVTVRGLALQSYCLLLKPMAKRLREERKENFNDGAIVCNLANYSMNCFK